MIFHQVLPPFFSGMAFLVLFLKLPGFSEFLGLPDCPSCQESTPYVPMLAAAYFATLTSAFMLYTSFPSPAISRTGLLGSIGLLISMTSLSPVWCVPCLVAHTFHVLAWMPYKKSNTVESATPDLNGIKATVLLVAPISALALFSTLNFTFMIYGLSHELPFTALIKEGAQLDTQSSELLTLEDFKASKGTVITFSAPNCPHCKGLFPKIDALAEVYKKEGIRFITVSRSVDTEWTSLQETLVDPKGSLMPLFGVSGFPTLFVVNPEGMILKAHAGATDNVPAIIENTLKNLL